ncbi:cellulase family glycosylhydrolase [Galbibacter sp. PAP.153]|uniref:cellulase family glycosylhydrolase n=1 Tax=Galbibacter sp. PAP.153 TaxID=3104623 RepID=UPI00300B7E8B
MKNLINILFLAITAIGFSQNLHTDGQKIVNEKGENILLKGIGLGGHMLQEGYMLKVPFSGQQHVFKQHIEALIGKEATAEFYNRWLANHTQKTDIDSLKSWGFNSVRLPMHYNLYTLPIEDEPVKGKQTWLEKGFQMTDSLLQWCKGNKMYLILDMHATPGGQGHDLNISDRDPSKPSLWESKANQEKLVALWQKLAERYKDEAWIGAYDIINEPNWAFTGKHKNGIDEQENKPLKKLMVEITKAIRKVDKKHILIIEGNGWGNNYNGVLPPWDDNMVISFHKYWNYNTQAEIQGFLDFRKKYNTPIWLGETGENSNVWFTDAITLMQQNNIGWCWWPLKKLGFNNPLEIKVNPGYQKLLDYWADKADKPTQKEAYDALMQLAEDAKIENNIFHKDVVDAMMRLPLTNGTKPYKAVNIDEDTLIKAVNYDLGKLGIAYFDTDYGNYYVSTGKERTGWNNGRTYRNDGIDIYKDESGYYVGDTQRGEWLQYTFEASEEGDYEIAFTTKTTSECSVLIENKDGYSEVITIAKNLSWNTSEAKKITLNKGFNQLKITVLKGRPDLKEILIKK